MTSCSLLCLPGLQSSEHNILVIGVPNVGKSSLINSLRRLHLKKGISARCQGSGRMWAQCHLCCDCVCPPRQSHCSGGRARSHQGSAVQDPGTVLAPRRPPGSLSWSWRVAQVPFAVRP